MQEYALGVSVQSLLGGDMIKTKPIRFLLLVPFLAVALLIIGFQSSQLVAETQLPKDQNARLPVEELSIVTSSGTHRFTAEIADTAQLRAIGLMFRESMLPTHGMLFDFGETAPIAMWMKNTILSLDMVFIKPDGTVLRVAKETKPYSLDIIPSGGPISHVLEVNAGIADKIDLKAGDQIKHRFFEAKE